MLAFDLCSSLPPGLVLALLAFLWMIGTAAKGAVNVTKKVVQSETAKEVGKGFLAGWLKSLFK